MKSAMVLFTAMLFVSCEKPKPKGSTTTEQTVTVTESQGEYKSDTFCDGKKYSDKDLNMAAMIVIKKQLPNDGNFFMFGKDRLLAAQKKLDEIGKWAMSIPNERIRNAYGSWVEYYLYSVTRDLESIEQARPTDDDLRQREFEASYARGKALAKCLPVPSK